MLVVREVYPDGHHGLTREHLDYICTMANRTKFSIVEQSYRSGSLATIKLNVAMKNPVFKVLLDDRSTQ